MMSGDNGEVKQEKTEEQLASERMTRYQADPYSFIEVNDIIACVINTPKGPALRLKGTVFQLKVALAELMIAIPEYIKEMVEANKPKIVTPQKHGILNFARRK